MNKRKPLSARQQQILEFIISQIQTRGFAPTVREIVSHVGDRSPTSVHRHLKTLEDRGHIVREANKSRSLRLTAEHRGLAISGSVSGTNTLELAADAPRIDPGELYDTNTHFMLKVAGAGMGGDHLDHGDLLIVRRQETCAEGDVAVVVLNGQNATVKRYRSSGSKVSLESISSDKNPIQTNRDAVKVVGVVVGMLRQFAASAAE